MDYMDGYGWPDEGRPQVVAADIGFGYANAASLHGLVRIPSVVCQSRKIRFDAGLGGDGIVISSEDGGEQFVGEHALLQGAYKQPLLDRSRTEDSTYTTLFRAVASELFGKDRRAPAGTASTTWTVCMNLVTGLPLEHYDDRSKVSEALEGVHLFERVDTGRSVRLEVSRCVCAVQHFGSVYYLALGREGIPREHGVLSERVGVVDIGTLTTGFIMADKLTYIENDSGSMNLGMSVVHRELQKEIYDQYGQDKPLHEIDACLRSGTIKVHGKSRSVKKLAAPYLEALADDIVRAARTLWGTASDLDRLVVVGGGAYELAERISKRYIPCEVPEEPELSNVRGLLRFGLFMDVEGLWDA